MIYIITGQPGAGKTYLMVHFTLQLYYNYNKDLQLYEYKNNPDNDQPYTVISNIEGFQLPHIDLDTAIKESKLPITKFFTRNYQDKISKKYPNLIYIIDECQRYFDQKMNDTECLYYFESHRHIANDIYLLAQSYKRINWNIRGLEYKRYHAITRLISVVGEFKYNVISEEESIETKVVMLNKDIFKLYKSSERKELKKSTNPYYKYFIIAGIALIICVYLAYKTFFGHRDKAEKQKEEIKQQQQNNVNTDKTNNEKIEQKQNTYKYYYLLSLVKQSNGNKIFYYFVDYKANQLYPLELLELPIITINKNGNIKKYVVSNYPDSRFTPLIEQYSKISKEESQAVEE